MFNRKFRASMAIFMSVLMLICTFTAAFAAAPQSTAATSPWHNFPLQKRWGYTKYNTIAIQSILYYYNNIYREKLGEYGIDGQYGPSTADAVELFQKNHGITETGEVNANTWDALYRVLDEIMVVPSPGGAVSGNSYYGLTSGGTKVLFCRSKAGAWSVNTEPLAKFETDWVWHSFGN